MRTDVRSDFHMTHEQIAKVLGLEKETVKTIERAAIRKLKRIKRLRDWANER